jgi:hypothetical protein
MPKRLLIVAVVHTPEAARPQEEDLGERLRKRFGLPTTVILVDAEGGVVGHGPG